MHGIEVPSPEEELAEARQKLLEEIEKLRRIVADDASSDKAAEEYAFIGKILARRNGALRKVNGRIDLDRYARSI